MHSDGSYPIFFTISPHPWPRTCAPKRSDQITPPLPSPQPQRPSPTLPCAWKKKRGEGRQEKKKRKSHHPSHVYLTPSNLSPAMPLLTSPHPCHSPQAGHALTQREREGKFYPEEVFTPTSLTHSPPCSFAINRATPQPLYPSHAEHHHSSPLDKAIATLAREQRRKRRKTEKG